MDGLHREYQGMLEWIMMGGGGIVENANLKVWTTVG